jgi:hypothetical protein
MYSGRSRRRAASSVGGLSARAAPIEGRRHTPKPHRKVLSGIRIERSERGQPGEFDWLDRLSIAELHLIAKGELDIESYRKNEDGSSRSRVH